MKHHWSICKTFSWIALVEVVTLQKHINNNLKTSNNQSAMPVFDDVVFISMGNQMVTSERRGKLLEF